MAIVRIVLGLVIGFALGLGCVIVGDMINHALFPPPPPEQWREYAVSAPFYKLMGLPVAYTLASFVAAFAGAKIAARIWAGWIAGGFLAGATFTNLFMIPHPLWMTVVCVVFVPAAVWFGAKLAAPKSQSLTQ